MPKSLIGPRRKVGEQWYEFDLPGSRKAGIRYMGGKRWGYFFRTALGVAIGNDEYYAVSYAHAMRSVREFATKPIPRDPFVQSVLDGKVPKFSADPSDPALQYVSMDIYSKPGTRVRFTGFGGYDLDQKHARQHLMIGSTYTVSKIDVSDWSSMVHLREVPGNGFNTVMFSEVDKEIS